MTCDRLLKPSAVARIQAWMAGSGWMRTVLVMALSVLALPSAALTLHQEDDQGNVNQVNIGVGKTNRHDSPSRHEDAPRRDQLPDTRKLSLDAYHSLDMRIPATLTYWGDSTPRVVIKAEPEVLKALKIHVAGGRLIIDSDGYSSQRNVEIKLYGGKLRDIRLQGGFEATFHQLDNDVEIAIRGAGELTADGGAMRCQLDADGAHEIDLSELRCRSLALSVLGSSDIEAYASESVSGLVQGAADVSISGNPDQRDIKVTGVADIAYE